MKIYDLLLEEKYKDKRLLEKLICIFESIKKEDLSNYYDKELSDDSLNKIDKAYSEIVFEKKPLEYVLWYVQFKWKKYKVNENTIIPRQETNLMIKAVENYLEFENEKNILLDIWAWCGVLALAVFDNYKEKISKVIMTDISKEALDVAKENTKFYVQDLSKIDFIVSDLLTDIPKTIFQEKVVLVANLPYIPDEVFEENAENSTKRYEPSLAFLWWKDGLDLYRKMFDQILNINPKKLVMFLEMMDEQIEIIKKDYPNFQIEVVEKFNFWIRIIKVYL